MRPGLDNKSGSHEHLLETQSMEIFKNEDKSMRRHQTRSHGFFVPAPR